MRVLVTGGAGFLGSHLLKLFEKDQKKNKLFALYNKNKPIGLKKTTKLIKADLVKINFSGHYDLVIHCASKNPLSKTGRGMKTIYKKNLQMTKNLINE